MPPETAPVPTTDGGGWTPKTLSWLLMLVLSVEVASIIYAAPLVALPKILTHYHTSQSAWITTAVTLVGAVWAPILGKYADLHGKRRLLIITLLISAAGSLLCTVAPTFGWLLAGRALQGAVLAAPFLCISLVRQTFPVKTIAVGVGVVATGSGLLTAGMPYFMGWLVDGTGFRSVFWFPAVMALVVAACVRALIPESPVRAQGRVDFLGALLLGAALAAVLAAISLGEGWGWLSLKTTGLFITGLAVLVLWVFQALRTREPLVDVRFLKQRPLVLTMLIAGLAGGSGACFFLMISIVSQTPPVLGLGYGFGTDSLGIARYLAPFSLGVLIGGIIGGQLTQRVGPARTLVISQVITVVGAVASAATITSAAGILVPIAVVGVGVGMAAGSAYNLIIELVPSTLQATIAGMASVMISVFSSAVPVVVIAILNSSFATMMNGIPLYSLSGVRFSFLVPGIIAAAGTITALALVAAQRGQAATAAADLPA
ncbi:MFS transporter [Streptomyces sp. NBC_00075]|uniref:MFS transporter n=1 Tax=Streptomyces sp. NBC_00075 TaxID=2975641 RepID=UPI003249C8DF